MEISTNLSKRKTVQETKFISWILDCKFIDVLALIRGFYCIFSYIKKTIENESYLLNIKILN